MTHNTSPDQANDWLMSPDPDESGPYGTGAPVYAELGYTGIVPVRPDGAKAKTIAMRGVSGRKGVQTEPRHYAGPRALPRYQHHNLGWRLPGEIIGIDIDHYGDKHGADDLADLEAKLGPLPPTWSSTARGEGPSRIYFFRVPTSAGELAGSLSESIEIIQRHHRYAMVWPSVHAATGGTYAWYNGVRSDVPPRWEQFADLPAAWLEHLSKVQWEHRDGAGMGVEDFRADYTTATDPDLTRRIRDAFDTAPSCRHDSMVKALGWACRAALEGKVVAGEVFDLLAADWDAATVGEGRAAEYDAMVRDIVRGTPGPDDTVLDDEYEEEAGPAEGPDFGPGLSREVQVEALRILRHEEARDAVRVYRARQRAQATASLTVADALEAVLGGAGLDVPTVGLIDGHEQGWGLFYPGHVNGIFGDGSVGKTVMMAEVQARELNGGGTVIHWEFDNNPMVSLVRRLIDAGARPDGIRSRFHVLFGQGDRDLLPARVRREAGLVTLDAVNPAVTSFALDPYHPGGIDTVLQECFQPFTVNGACGVFLDHVGHEAKDRQHGSIRKAQAVQGALYQAVMDAPLKPGSIGRTRLVLCKDNRGSLGDAQGRTVSVAVMASQAQRGQVAGRVLTVFTEPDPFMDGDGPRPADNVIRIAREMDRAGLPVDLSQRAARSWLEDKGVEIEAKTDDWRAAWNLRRQGPAGSPPGMS